MIRRILVLATALAALTFAETKKFSLLDEFQLELAQDPQLSPDGKRIVYVRQFADILSDRRYSNLWIIQTDGAGNRPLTTGNFNDTAPRWSPDGTQLAYISNRDGTTQLYRRWMDTGDTSKVTNVTSSPAGLAWSPDGKWLSFTMLVADTPRKIATLPAAPEGAKWADPARVFDRIPYRFNGAGYLKPGYWQAFIVPADGGAPRQITSGNFQHGGPASRASDPVWSPDGQYLLQSLNRSPRGNIDSINTEVYEFRIGDGEVHALTSRDGPDNAPVISPDGSKIAYTGFDDRKQGYRVTHLYLMNRDGSGSRMISASYDRDIGGVRWSPDGKGVYFTSDNQGNTGLYFMTLDGVVLPVARDLGSSVSSYGGGGSYTLARDGTVAFTFARPDRPGDIAVTTTAGGTPRILTAVNESLFASRQLASVEELWYTSSKDQRKIHGWIVKPPGFDPAKKYPLILEIHGGPFADYGDRFDWEKQLMAASGYVVLYTNPRGSTSYGEEFGNLIHHAYPGDDFYDLNSGVDAVIAKGYIDPNQVFVTGGSGGGVLTCWMIGHTTRFRAAVPVYPVINWYSFVLTSDIPFTAYYWFPGLPWDNVESYEKRSLLSVVKNVKTPTLVMTGEADYRTPISDSEQYFQALQLLGVESVLVRMPDEPHGIAVRPSHHISKVAHIIGWFDQHR